jgi:hypothetical protein
MPGWQLAGRRARAAQQSRRSSSSGTAAAARSAPAPAGPPPALLARRAPSPSPPCPPSSPPAGQRHIFEHWKALNTAQKTALLESLGALAAWSGQARKFPALARAGAAPSWQRLSERQRKELLVAADQLGFDWVEEVLQVGGAGLGGLVRGCVAASGVAVWWGAGHEGSGCASNSAGRRPARQRQAPGSRLPAAAAVHHPPAVLDPACLCRPRLPSSPLQDGENVSANQALWQVDQPPAMLSAEPLVMRDCVKLIGALREMLPHLEERTKAAFGRGKAKKVQVSCGGGGGGGAGWRVVGAGVRWEGVMHAQGPAARCLMLSAARLARRRSRPPPSRSTSSR